MRIHYLQHVPFEDPAEIFNWARARRAVMAGTRLFEGDRPPGPKDFDALVVMGGPMNIYEHGRYPFLKDEKRAIAEAVAAGRIVVGVCLGAQLIADALGARVRRNRWREIGWFPVRPTPAAGQTPLADLLPVSVDVFHWHGDTFEMPAGAVHLASSTACANQAFLYDGRVLGLQFHLETTPASARGLVAHCGHEIDGGPFVQDPAAMLADPARFARANALLYRWLDRLLELSPV
jgi:GMP synthase (glutamine-hydrolysing)